MDTANNNEQTGGEKKPPQQGARPFHRPQGGYPARGGSRPASRGNNSSRHGGPYRDGPRGTGARPAQGGAPRPESTVAPATRVKHLTSRDRQRGRRMGAPFVSPKEILTSVIPPLKEGDVRFIHLGGVEEIGRNMSFVEFDNDIVIVDCGFQFSEEGTPGIDYILPNTEYLEQNKHKIRGLVVTHGHLDHIGGIPYIMEKIGNPPLYCRNFTSLMIQKRQEEFPHLPPLDIQLVEKGQVRTLGKIKVNFFGVTHAIPDSMGVVIETPYGDVVHTGDLRLDHTDGEPSEIEIDVYEFFKNRKTLLLVTDSTNAENPGFSISEKVILKNIEEIIRDTKGRLIISTFASQVERLLKMIEIAEKYGKKIVIEGRSMKTNVEIAKIAKIINAKPETFVTTEEMEHYPPDRIVILATGQQGEEFAALMRIANKTHKYIRLTPRDTILLSSSIVPGNERNVQKLKDNLSRQGAYIISYKSSDVHSSGHANADELAWIHQKINPKFFVPAHGYHYFHRIHAEIAKRATGIADDHIIIPDNGMVIEIQDQGTKIIARKDCSANRTPVFVDGFSVGGMQEVVLRDRKTLAANGIFVVVSTLNTATGRVTKSPDIISRGFVYLRESQELLRQARYLTKKTIEDNTLGVKGTQQYDFDFLKDQVTDAIEHLLFQETAKLPIVIPVILTV